MNFRPKRQQDPEINITPLIDMVFLLLIFFMVSSSFTRQSELELTLPRAAANPAEQQPETIEVVIDRNGQWYVEGNLLPDTGIATMRRSLEAALPRDMAEPPTLIISADASATYQAVVDVMDAARQLGLHRISFPTRDLDER